MTTTVFFGHYYESFYQLCWKKHEDSNIFSSHKWQICTSQISLKENAHSTSIIPTTSVKSLFAITTA